MRLLNQSNTTPEELSLNGGVITKLSTLVSLVSSGKINRGAYKETIEAVFTDNVEPETYIAENGLTMQSDDKIISEAANAVINENLDAVAGYMAGKEKIFGFLLGQVMKRLGGSGNPGMAGKALKEALDEQEG